MIQESTDMRQVSSWNDTGKHGHETGEQLE
jgi:hypothetical protein